MVIFFLYYYCYTGALHDYRRIDTSNLLTEKIEIGRTLARIGWNGLRYPIWLGIPTAQNSFAIFYIFVDLPPKVWIHWDKAGPGCNCTDFENWWHGIDEAGGAEGRDQLTLALDGAPSQPARDSNCLTTYAVAQPLLSADRRRLGSDSMRLKEANDEFKPFSNQNHAAVVGQLLSTLFI